MQKIGTLIFSDKSKADNFLRTIRIHVLKVNIVNTINDKYEFKVHCKDFTPTFIFKNNFFISSNTIKPIFKRFLHRAHTI